MDYRSEHEEHSPTPRVHCAAICVLIHHKARGECQERTQAPIAPQPK